MSRHHTTFKKAADRIKQSEFVIPVFIVFALLWLMSMFFAAEDYWTSLVGYEGLPTQAGFWWTGYMVAALPSVGQVAAGYIALALGWDEQEDRKYTVVSLLIWTLLFSIDAFTDMSYRMSVPNGTSPTVVMIAVFQTVGVFTVGTELAFVVGFGMTMNLLPEAWGQVASIKTKIKRRYKSITEDLYQ